MRIYLDLDCLEKLAACELLDDILKRLGASHEHDYHDYFQHYDHYTKQNRR